MTNEQIAQLVERLGRFYHSEYVALNQPWIRETRFDVWLRKQLLDRGVELKGGDTRNERTATDAIMSQPAAAVHEGSIA